MSATRKLVLRKISCPCDCHCRVQIIEQTHRGHDFTPVGNLFKASNGVRLKSVNRINHNAYQSTLFLRGDRPECDNMQVRVLTEEWVKIKEAVKEYNQKFGKQDVLGKHGVVR